jgi:hypothetical protein
VSEIAHSVKDTAVGYPDNNPKTLVGLTKPPLWLVPPVAILHMAMAFADGERKYGAYNWRKNKVSASIYLSAGDRHKKSWLDGEELAPDSLCHHLAHEMACNAILLDALATGNLIDDRPTPGNFAQLCKEMTKPLKAG